jgi:carbonic anhydrase/acetyltransferase-like protein (isoleucine patch superfamily)
VTGRHERGAETTAMPATILPFRGLYPKIHESAFIADTAVIIGDVEIGPEASIWYGCVVRGDVNAIRIGARTNVQDGTIIHVNSDKTGGDYRETGGGIPTYIGSDITIGHMALIHACVLEDACFIGMRSVVMDEAVVESGSMVAAGAVVTPRKRVERGQLWSGTPAKHQRDLTEGELAFFPKSVEGYVNLGQQHKAGG